MEINNDMKRKLSTWRCSIKVESFKEGKTWRRRLTQPMQPASKLGLNFRWDENKSSAAWGRYCRTTKYSPYMPRRNKSTTTSQS
jgi:hypothetical protein